MGSATYLVVLIGIFVGSIWLEFALRTHVLRRWRRAALALVPGLVVFVSWDLYAISAGHWTFDPDRVLGIELPLGMPLEELLFFLVVPFAAILTLEAVRSVKGWSMGDLPRDSESAR